MPDLPIGKVLYIVFTFLVIVFLGFAFIGANASQQLELIFYIMFLGVPALGVFITVWIVQTFLEKDPEDLPVDTATIEDPPEQLEWLSPKIQLIIGGIISLVLIGKIIVTGSAFVAAPRFAIFASTGGNALVSGLVGIIEDMAFFGVIAASSRAFVRNITGSELLAFAIGLMVSVSVFTGYHFWRYGAVESDLASVAFFALLSVTASYLTRSLIISNLMHATNNAAVTFLFIQRVGFLVFTGSG